MDKHRIQAQKDGQAPDVFDEEIGYSWKRPSRRNIPSAAFKVTNCDTPDHYVTVEQQESATTWIVKPFFTTNKTAPNETKFLVVNTKVSWYDMLTGDSLPHNAIMCDVSERGMYGNIYVGRTIKDGVGSVMYNNGWTYFTDRNANCTKYEILCIELQ